MTAFTDNEDVIFKTRDEFEKMLLAEIEAFYGKGKVCMVRLNNQTKKNNIHKDNIK